MHASNSETLDKDGVNADLMLMRGEGIRQMDKEVKAWPVLLQGLWSLWATSLPFPVRTVDVPMGGASLRFRRAFSCGAGGRYGPWGQGNSSVGDSSPDPRILVRKDTCWPWQYRWKPEGHYIGLKPRINIAENEEAPWETSSPWTRDVNVDDEMELERVAMSEEGPFILLNWVLLTFPQGSQPRRNIVLMSPQFIK